MGNRFYFLFSLLCWLWSSAYSISLSLLCLNYNYSHSMRIDMEVDITLVTDKWLGYLGIRLLVFLINLRKEDKEKIKMIEILSLNGIINPRKLSNSFHNLIKKILHWWSIINKGFGGFFFGIRTTINIYGFPNFNTPLHIVFYLHIV